VAESWIVRLPGTESAGLPADVGPARRDVTLGDDVTSVDTLLGGSDVDGEQHAVTLVVAAWADLVPRRWASRVLAGDESSYEAWLEEMFAAEAETVWNRPDLLLERLVARAGSAERVHVVVAQADPAPSAEAAALLQATRREYARRGWGQDVFDQYFVATVWPRRQRRGAPLGVPERAVGAARRLVEAAEAAAVRVTGARAEISKQGPAGGDVIPRAVSAATGADVLTATIEATVDPAEVAAGHAAWRRTEDLSWRELVALLRRPRTRRAAGERTT